MCRVVDDDCGALFRRQAAQVGEAVLLKDAI
jgi:hypothetical protein